MTLIEKLFTRKEDEHFNCIYAPVAGEAVDLTEVPNPVFAEGTLGDGVAITPVTVNNAKNFATFNTFSGKTVSNDDMIIELKI